MKEIYLGFFCIVCVSVCYAQDSTNCYFDEQLQLTSKKNAAYNGRMIQQNGKWEAFAYFSNGAVLFHGIFKDKKLTEKDGQYTLYFPNGTKRAATYFSDNTIDSVFTSWYADGNRSDSGLMRNNIKEGLWKTWYPGGAVESEGDYVNCSPDAIWHWYHSNGKPATIETYKNHKLNELSCFDTLGNNTGSNCRIDKKPCPQNALSFDQFVVDNMIYPDKALKRSIEGTVNFEFLITKEGKLTRINFLNETDALLQDEVVKFLKSIPVWEPAISHNREIDYLYTYEVPFYLPQ